ncbi:MAG: hypothetical protein LBV12_11205 [Puniceicoccales bacterium]|jgi:hypothetical protein|nr:hypothetical protein [Puniceicoccales bacterium]
MGDSPGVHRLIFSDFYKTSMEKKNNADTGVFGVVWENYGLQYPKVSVYSENYE